MRHDDAVEVPGEDALEALPGGRAIADALAEV
jgi:hypothetical protein